MIKFWYLTQKIQQTSPKLLYYFILKTTSLNHAANWKSRKSGIHRKVDFKTLK